MGLNMLHAIDHGCIAYMHLYVSVGIFCQCRHHDKDNNLKTSGSYLPTYSTTLHDMFQTMKGSNPAPQLQLLQRRIAESLQPP